MAKYENCSCGGLKIDGVTLQVDEATGRLYTDVYLIDKSETFTGFPTTSMLKMGLIN